MTETPPSPEHPRPWRVGTMPGFTDSIVYDANGGPIVMMAAPGLAAQIVESVNRGTGPVREPEKDCPVKGCELDCKHTGPHQFPEDSDDAQQDRADHEPKPLAPDEAGPTDGELAKLRQRLREILSGSGTPWLTISAQLLRDIDRFLAGRASLEADQFVPTHFERIPESDDGDTVCDGCGSTMDGDEPHTWKECLPIAIENIQSAEGQVNDYLSQEVTRLTEQLSATEEVVEAAKKIRASQRYRWAGYCDEDERELIRAVDALAESQRGVGEGSGGGD